MENDILQTPTTRREFLKSGLGGIGLVAFSSFAPAFLTQTTLAKLPAPEKDRSILVLIQLAGGNDGLNTLIPFEDANYYRLRPRLGLRKDAVTPITHTLGFHKSCGELAELHREGKLCIIQNVGYPNPNRSHFRSMEIWETGSDSDEYLQTGWLGRYFDNKCDGAPPIDEPAGIHISNQLPQSFHSEQTHNLYGLSLQRNNRRQPTNQNLLEELITHTSGDNTAGFLKHTMMDALVTEKEVKKITTRYRPAVDYPRNPLARSLQQVASMIAAGMETRVYFVSHRGFDTHTNQLNTHAQLLAALSQAMAAFQSDLESHSLQDQVLTMTFSEFGRRPAENNGRGTDHGTAAPLFIMGNSLKQSLIGRSPNLNVDTKSDLIHSIDFRQVYSTLLNKWFDCDPANILGKKYKPLSFI